MRNIRARRRFKATLIFLLTLSVIMFFENRIEAFAPKIKFLVEERMENIFGKNVDISIGSIDGGIVRPIALRDVKILSKASASGQSRIFLFKNIVSNYRIWDLVFPDKFKKEPRVEINFETKNKELSGFVTLRGAIDNASLRGHVRVFGSDRIDIDGRIKNGVARFIMRPKSGLVRIEGNFAADGVLIISVKASHLRLRDIDISGGIVIRNIAVKNSSNYKDESFEGDIEAKNLIVNYKPFFELKGSYKIYNETLEVSDLNLGNLLYANGKFGLKSPYIIDAQITTDNMNISQVLSSINTSYGAYASGTMNSKFELKGTIKNLKSKTRLEIKKGRIGEVSFEYLGASFKGDGPVVRIEDSRIVRESGPVVLDGEMDLRRLGKDSLFENIKVINGENTMVWDEWETAKWQDAREFSMTKNIAGGFNVGFKKYVSDDKIDESLRERDKFEFGYNLHPNDSIKVKVDDNSKFFGLEHKDKF